ncbi:MAG: serine/threonine protein phosphatase [Bacteroidetes bacterium]|nr:serine/threonine protein phosphatase [Bacteroidota bacterium]
MQEPKRLSYLLPKIEGNTWVIGDVHGYISTLKALVEKVIAAKKGDQLIFLGDLVDRGPNVKATLDYVMGLKAHGIDVHCIRGNHDDLFVKSYHESTTRTNKRFLFLQPSLPLTASWLQMGGKETLQSFNVEKVSEVDPKYIDFIDSLPYFIESENYLFVHAGFDFESNKPFEDTNAMMWIRHYKVDLEKTKGRKVIHGHTPVSIDFIEMLVKNNDENFLVLDNGIYQSEREKGRLMAFNINTSTLKWQMNCD